MSKSQATPGSTATTVLFATSDCSSEAEASASEPFNSSTLQKSYYLCPDDFHHPFTILSPGRGARVPSCSYNCDSTIMCFWTCSLSQDQNTPMPHSGHVSDHTRETSYFSFSVIITEYEKPVSLTILHVTTYFWTAEHQMKAPVWT